MTAPTTLEPVRRRVLQRRIRLIVACTIGYNVVEAVIALTAGTIASSAALLVGLLLNYWFGWAWADSIAALVIAGFAVREGLEAWRGDACAVPIAALTGERVSDGCAHEDEHGA
jgi:hypothetical protein